MSRGPVQSTPSAGVALRPLAGARIIGGFWAARQAANRAHGIPQGARQLREAGNLENLRLAAAADGRPAPDAYHGPLYMDSDAYKWVEAVAWEHGRAPGDELAAELQEWTAAIAASQADDGYLNSFVRVTGGARYADLAFGHELYCMGHLIQAAIAVVRATGDTTLLAVARRAADHLVATFGPEGSAGLDGHPVIEMALVELYRETGDAAYLALARWFVATRGRSTIGDGRFARYLSDRVPVRDAERPEGHAVRALYLAAGAADVAAEDADARSVLAPALERQWAAMVESLAYLTGGLGARRDGEAFGEAFELPPDTAYCETCAAIAGVQWSWRMLLATGAPRFADLIERILFNGFAAGVALDGASFFYVNPLEVAGGAHRRAGWFECACCPPNVMRTLSSLDSVLATSDADCGIQVHQYAPCTLRTGDVELAVHTGYPWEGRVEVEVQAAPTGAEWTLSLRVPPWATGATLAVQERAYGGPGGATLDGDPVVPGAAATVRRAWRVGDRAVLDLPLAARVTEADPRVAAIRGHAAIERGPLVYCLEEVDQPAGATVAAATLPPDPAFAERTEPALEDAVSLTLPSGLVAVPYALWANRAPGAMRVWLPQAGD